MIRPTVAADTPELLRITQGTGLFSPADLEALDAVLAAYHEENAAEGHRCFTYESHGKAIGFAYYAPAAMTDRTWYLWWIAVDKQTQARGVGGKLLKHVEDAARADNGRLMMIDTSGLPSYELTRKFYLKHGYEVAAAVKDFYADGHDLVMFRKRLALKAPESVKAGDIVGSIADFDRQIEFDPRAKISHWQRGISYDYAGQWEFRTRGGTTSPLRQNDPVRQIFERFGGAIDL